MTLKTILFNPKTNEILPSSAQMVADYNASESNSNLHISIEDQNDLNEMFGIQEITLQ